jgi:hypothetical protein
VRSEGLATARTGRLTEEGLRQYARIGCHRCEDHSDERLVVMGVEGRILWAAYERVPSTRGARIVLEGTSLRAVVWDPVRVRVRAAR